MYYTLFRGNVKIFEFFWLEMWQCMSKDLKPWVIFYMIIPLLGNSPQKIFKEFKDLGTRMFTAVL